MTLDELCTRIGTAPPASGGDCHVADINADSRAVGLGCLFAALPGTQAHGATYAPQAIAAGGVAILTDAAGHARLADASVPVLVADEPRRAYARACAALWPRQPATIAAVTGTNGKSSVADFTRQIWARIGHRALSVGTLGIICQAGETASTTPLALTTPDAREIHRALDTAAGDGIDHAVIEASSHGLAQHRMDSVRVKAAAFTNLLRDHRDYHATPADYLQAKLRLFADVLDPAGTAIVYGEDRNATAFERAARDRSITLLRVVGASGEGDIRVLSTAPDAGGQALLLEIGGRRHELRLALPGGFQAVNACLAIALVWAGGAALEPVLDAVAHLRPVPGRLERVATLSNGATIYVDYAHKTDALDAALRALRSHAAGRLHLVFGCGGDRDREKRSEMGELAVRLADMVIVTDDNPRGEAPGSIRAAVLAAAPGAHDIGDRREAIATAVEGLGPGDVLLIAGKGHETYQIVGDQRLLFDDSAEARRAAAARDAAL